MPGTPPGMVSTQPGTSTTIGTSGTSPDSELEHINRVLIPYATRKAGEAKIERNQLGFAMKKEMGRGARNVRRDILNRGQR